MRDVSIESIRMFNEELRSLAAAGMPLELGLSRHVPLRGVLDGIDSQLTVDIGRGLTIEQAFATAPYLPSEYRTALASWLRCEVPTVALDGPATSANALRQLQEEVRGAFLQPLIIIGLVFCAFLYLCLSVVPQLEAIYNQAFILPSRSLRVLMVARDWLPVWSVFVPLVVSLATIWIRICTGRSKFRWLPGSRKYFASIRHANYAERMASMLEQDVPLEEALSLAGPIGNRFADGNQTPMDSSRSIEADKNARKDSAANALPSLLSWALAGDLVNQSRSGALRMSAGVYRQTAQRQVSVWRAWMPTVTGVLFGGVIVVAYTLCVFIPVIELIYELTKPEGAFR